MWVWLGILRVQELDFTRQGEQGVQPKVYSCLKLLIKDSTHSSPDVPPSFYLLSNIQTLLTFQVVRWKEKTVIWNSQIILDKMEFKWLITMTYTFPWWFWHHRVEFGHFHKARTRLETGIVGNSSHISIHCNANALSELIDIIKVKKSKRFWHSVWQNENWTLVSFFENQDLQELCKN